MPISQSHTTYAPSHICRLSTIPLLRLMVQMDAAGFAVCIPIPVVVSVPDPITSEEEEASVRQKRLSCCAS
jgi:hypothetical protein